MKEYTQISIKIPSQWEEAFTMCLFEAAAEGVEVEDPAIIQAHLDAGDWDASVFDGQQMELGEVGLRSLFPERELAEAAAEAARQLAAELGVTAAIQLEQIPEVDWQSKWKESFVSIPVGERLWLSPAWDENRAPEGRVKLRINPGQAFGTGDHATTRMALCFLEEHLREGESIIDLGCGSGLLGIAGLKLGASHVTAVDIDPVCGPSVEEHCRLNGITEEQFTFHCGDVLSDERLQRKLRRDNKADIVVANITAQVIFDLARIVGRFMSPGARLICSGILDEYAPDIADRLVNCGMAVIGEMHEQGWTSFACVPAYE